MRVSRRPVVLWCFHFINTTRVHQTILRPFGPFPVNTMLRAGEGGHGQGDEEAEKSCFFAYYGLPVLFETTVSASGPHEAEVPLLPLSSLRVYCLLYTSPSPRDMRRSRMPSSA